jgi:hypothetical protein
MKPKLVYFYMRNITMEYKEPKKRVTKNDKKNKKGVYTSKHIRNILKQKETAMSKRNDGPVSTPERPLLPNGRV